jgi:ABC-2 type transport system ATP-binding protein
MTAKGDQQESAVRAAVPERFRPEPRSSAWPTAAASSGTSPDQGLELVGLAKRFGDVVALADVGVQVGRGRVVGFLGPNGAGKTTVMRAVFGLVALDAGEVRFAGRPVGLHERLRFGYMPEERGLYPRMRLGDQLVYFASLHGLSSRGARTATRTWLERLGLAERAAARVEELSHGNQQRAQLAAALLHEPDLLVLDEPFAGLDPLAVQTLAGVLRGEAERGAAVLFSSHQLELVEDVCEDVAIIDRGRVIATGHIDDLCRASPRRRIEVRVAGGAPAGWLPGVAGVELAERRGDELHLTAPRDVDPQLVLAAVAAAGEVVDFRYGPPSLADLFLELVAR